MSVNGAVQMAMCAYTNESSKASSSSVDGVTTFDERTNKMSDVKKRIRRKRNMKKGWK